MSGNSGYIVTNVVVDGSFVGASNSYTFSNVVTNHTINALFGPTAGTNYAITASAGPNGSIVPSGAVSVPSGSNQTFTMSGNTGYIVTNVVVDGSSVGAPTSYTFSNVVTNHTINALFGFSGGGSFLAWKNSMTVAFSGYNKPETLTNFPALVVLSTNIPGFAYNQFASGNGYDLRFSTSGGSNELSYEIEQWNSGGSSYVWVQVPLLANSNTYIWAYWGNTNTGVAAAPAVYTTNGAVWPTNAFVGVWHMAQANALDSTANRNNGTASGSVINSPGVVDGAEKVAGGSYVNIADTLSLNFITNMATISGWVCFNTLPSGEQAITRNEGEWASMSTAVR